MTYVPKPDGENVNVSKGNPLGDFIRLTLGVFLLIGLAAGVLIALGGFLIDFLPRSAETQLFERLKLESYFKSPSPQSEALTSLQDLLNRLRQAEAEPAYEYKATVICDEDPNAFAFPGGAIGVTSGLFKTVHSENGLAFVLAHELGHFQNRDHLRSLGRGIGFLLAGTLLGFGGESGVPDFFSRLIALSFDRRQEEKADAYALTLLHKVYGHTGGASEFFNHLDKNKHGWTQNLPSFLSTHPSSKSRTALITNQTTQEAKPPILTPLQTKPPLCP